MDDYYFSDRLSGAKRLYDELSLDILEDATIIVLALSDGAVPIADYIATKMGIDMDVLLSEAIYSSKNPDLEIARVSETQEVLIHKTLTDSFGVNEEFIYDEARSIFEDKLLYKINKYRKGAFLDRFDEKTVLLVDECVETDFTMMLAIKTAIENGARNIYVAAPIMDQFSYENLVMASDGVFCVYRKNDYISIEYYYEKLQKVEFSDIERILTKYE